MTKFWKNSYKNKKYIELIFFGLISLILISIISILQKKLAIDDAFITYRYAENIAKGNGFVYNIGEPSLGTTTPFYTLILAFISLFYQNIPVISYLIGLTSILIITILIFNLFKQLKYTFGGILSALLICINSEMFMTYGMETLFYTMLVFASIYFYMNKKLNLTAILLTMLVLTRIDGLVLAFILFFDMYYRNRKINMSMIIFTVLLLLPWFIYSYYTFGLLISSTISSKMIQIDSGLFSENFTYGAFRILIPKYFILLILSVLGLLYSFQFRKQFLIFFYWAFFYFLAYSLIDVPYYGWYLTPLIPALIFSATLGSLYIYNLIVKSKWITYEELKPIIAFLIIIVLFFSIIYTNIIYLNNLIKSPNLEESNQREAFYKEISKWFNQHTNASESIETVEVGIIGYYSKRKIIDGVGLIQPKIAQHLLKKDFDWSINEYKPDYILLSPMFRWLLPPGEWIKKYRIIDKYTVPSGEWYVVKRITFINDSNTYFSFAENIQNASVMNLLNSDYSIGIMDEGDELKYTFLEHPLATSTAEIIFNRIYIPENATLKFAISLDPQVWSPDKGDGVNFSISISNKSTTQTIFSKYIDPKRNKNDRKWHESKIDLTEWSRQNVSVIFETSSGPRNDPTYDWARWGNPVLIKSE